MASKVQAKQIDKWLKSSVSIDGITVNGFNQDVSTEVASVLATAGEHNGSVTSVPVQVSTANNVVGVVVSSPFNRVEIYSNTTKEKISDGAGNEVYGRLTEALGVYTLDFFSLVSGVETTFSLAEDIDVEFVYNFDFRTFPSGGIVGVKNKRVNDDISNSNGRNIIEARAVTALNTITSLSLAPTTLSVILNVNGVNEYEGIAFTRVGTVITRLPAGAGYDLETTDTVLAHYNTLA